jgi:hypothetical protein
MIAYSGRNIQVVINGQVLNLCKDEIDLVGREPGRLLHDPDYIEQAATQSARAELAGRQFMRWLDEEFG